MKVQKYVAYYRVSTQKQGNSGLGLESQRQQVQAFVNCSECIIAENHLLVYPRPGYPVEATFLPQNVRTVSSPVFEISSTFIRRAIEEGKDVRYFLHPAVCDELKRMQNESLN